VTTQLSLVASPTVAAQTLDVPSNFVVLPRHLHARISRQDALRSAADLYVRQYGVATRTQLLACGLSARQVERRLAEGRLFAVARGVYALEAMPDSWERQAIGAVLVTQTRHHPGALSHDSAAAAWGISGFDRCGTVFVTAHLSDRHVNPLAVMNRAADLVPDDIVVGPLGVATTTTIRTALDLAIRTSKMEAINELFDRVVGDGHASLVDLRDRAEAMTGRPGIIAMRRVLARRVRESRRRMPRKRRIAPGVAAA
jgi:Transcriptional regulator, AbiEi antitoxin